MDQFTTLTERFISWVAMGHDPLRIQEFFVQEDVPHQSRHLLGRMCNEVLLAGLWERCLDGLIAGDFATPAEFMCRLQLPLRVHAQLVDLLQPHTTEGRERRVRFLTKIAS